MTAKEGEIVEQTMATTIILQTTKDGEDSDMKLVQNEDDIELSPTLPSPMTEVVCESSTVQGRIELSRFSLK